MKSTAPSIAETPAKQDGCAGFAARTGSDVRPVNCPDCGEAPWIIEGTFRLHVSCENEKCPKRPRGRRQGNEAMSVSSWNWATVHGGLYYDREEISPAEQPLNDPSETVGRAASEGVAAAPPGNSQTSDDVPRHPNDKLTP